MAQEDAMQMNFTKTLNIITGLICIAIAVRVVQAYMPTSSAPKTVAQQSANESGFRESSPSRNIQPAMAKQHVEDSTLSIFKPGTYYYIANHKSDISLKQIASYCSKIEKFDKFGMLGSLSTGPEYGPLAELVRANGYDRIETTTGSDGLCRVNIGISGIYNGKSYKFRKSCLLTAVRIDDDGAVAAKSLNMYDCD